MPTLDREPEKRRKRRQQRDHSAHKHCQQCKTLPSDAVNTLSRDAGNNERALELLATPTKTNQAVRLATKPLRDGAAVPQRRPMVRGRRARVW